MARHATESNEHNICDFEKHGTVCHGISKSLLSYCINWDQESNNIGSYVENIDTEKVERGWDWCFARGKIHIGFTCNMTVRSSQEAGFDIS